MKPIKAQESAAYIVLSFMLQFTSLRVTALTHARPLTAHGGLPLSLHHSDTSGSIVNPNDAASGINATLPTTSTRRPEDTAKPSQGAMPNSTANFPTLESPRFTTAFTTISTSTRIHVQDDPDKVTDTDKDACTRAFETFQIAERDSVPTSCFALDPISLTDDPDPLSSLPDVSSQHPSPTPWTNFDTPIPASVLTQSIPTTKPDSRSNITSVNIGTPDANSTVAMNATMVPGLLPTVTFTTRICLW